MKHGSIATALLVPALLAGCSVQITPGGFSASTCAHANTYAEAFPADGVNMLKVDAWAGALNLRAVEGLTEVRVEAKACASDIKLLETLGLKAEKSGDQVRVDVIRSTGFGFNAGWVDVTIDLPANLAAQISDTSGSTVIDGLAAVEVRAGSGDLRITRTTGKTEIREKSSGSITLEQLKGDLVLGQIGSGELTVHDVAGEVSLAAKSSGTIKLTGISGQVKLDQLGSGDLRVRQVGGLLLRSKSSGTILIEEAGGHVLLERIGSGSLTVDGVQGDLTVQAKSSGSVQTSNVTGKVDLPSR